MSDALIFISYSHKDVKWKNRLEEQLGVLEQEGNLKLWSDEEIGAGEDWYQKIDDALKNASVAVLLVSASSLTSKFILRKEVKDLLQLRLKSNKRIIPIIIKDCLWEKVTWLASMQVRPAGGGPLEQKANKQINTELKKIAAEIAEIIGAESRAATDGTTQALGEPQDTAKPRQVSEAGLTKGRLDVVGQIATLMRKDPSLERDFYEYLEKKYKAERQAEPGRSELSGKEVSQETIEPAEAAGPYTKSQSSKL